MADAFTPNFNLTLPEVGASFDTWGTKLNADLSVVDKHLVPVGAILMWSGAVVDIPNNWALCDGANGTPDLRDRFIVGAGSTYAPDAVGGSNSVTLAVDHIPAHGHTGSTAEAGGHDHTTGTSGAHTHGGSTGSAGGHSHTTGSAGGHSHSASTGSAGAHSHSVRAYGGSATSSALSYDSINMGNTNFSLSTLSPTTTSAPNHTHSVSIGSVASHTHSVSTVSDHTHSISSGGDHTHTVSTVGDHTHTVSVGDTGGGAAHENRPPFYALAYIMCTG